MTCQIRFRLSDKYLNFVRKKEEFSECLKSIVTCLNQKYNFNDLECNDLFDDKSDSTESEKIAEPDEEPEEFVVPYKHYIEGRKTIYKGENNEDLRI